LKLQIDGRDVVIPFEVVKLNLIGSEVTILARPIQNDDRLDLYLTAQASGLSESDIEPQSRRWIFDDYIGGILINVPTWALATTGAGSGAGVSTTANNGDSSHFGIATLTTGTSGTGAASLWTRHTAPMAFGERAMVYEAAVYVPTASDGTDTFTVRCGFGDGLVTEGSNGAFFRYTHSVNGGRWECVTRDAGSETAADSGIAGAGAWAVLRVHVEADGGTITFSIDGVAVETATTDIPTASLGHGTHIVKSAGTNARTLLADYQYWRAN
jgi:hypothetical protein